jgi:chromate reductase, NAD(P)H dehydrogenase (quinone)
MNVTILPGSLRRDSLNKKLAHVVERILLKDQRDVVFCDLKDFPMPVYDGDIEMNEGIPAGVRDLDHKIKSSQALIIVTPEYNGSIPGVLKNTIDWLSRLEPHCFTDQQILLLGASPGALGAIRSLTYTRQPLVKLDAHVYPTVYGLPKAHQAFDENGNLVDPKIEAIVKSLVLKFVRYAETIHHAEYHYEEGAVELA